MATENATPLPIAQTAGAGPDKFPQPAGETINGDSKPALQTTNGDTNGAHLNGNHPNGNQTNGEHAAGDQGAKHEHHGQEPSGIEPSGVKGKIAAGKDKLSKKEQKIKDMKDPAGGFDDTPIPSARDGYTVKFTFHRAEQLPVSDLAARSSDPYIHATLTSDLPTRHKEDPDMILRTPTVHKSTDPVWNTEWIVAGIPSSGFRLKCRLYDEDPSDHDDRLGNVTIHVNHVDDEWPGIQDQGFGIKKRMGSKRAYLLRGIVATFNHDVHMSGNLFVSAEVIGKSDEPYGRMYTLGKTRWFKHFSPMIGYMLGTKAPGSSAGETEGGEKKSEKYELVIPLLKSPFHELTKH